MLEWVGRGMPLDKDQRDGRAEFLLKADEVHFKKSELCINIFI